MISPTPFSLCCALLLCLPLAFVFTSTTTTTTTSPPTSSPPPPSLPADEETLFRLASRVNSHPSPSNAPKRIAFMFLTTSPLPFAPLWELFFHSATTSDHTQLSHSHSQQLFNIYIHADPNSSNYSNPPFSGVFTNRVIPSSKPTQRFTPSLIAAARRLLAHALIHDSTNTMFALVSPTCIPLHSFNFTYSTLLRLRSKSKSNNNNKSFIEILNNEPGAYDRWVARGEDVMLPDVPFRNFRVGSQFFVLTRRHAKLVVKDQRIWSKFKLPCVKQDVCYPEEHYFATLINMRDPLGCVPATLTHVDWRGHSDGHPRTYQAFEVGPELILMLRRDRPRYGDDGSATTTTTTTNGSDSSVNPRRHDDPFLFARKFSPDSLRPLMRIANEVIFKDY